MYYVMLSGEIKRTFDAKKLKSLINCGFYVTSKYVDAVIYSRALLCRGKATMTAENYFQSEKIF